MEYKVFYTLKAKKDLVNIDKKLVNLCGNIARLEFQMNFLKG